MTTTFKSASPIYDAAVAHYPTARTFTITFGIGVIEPPKHRYAPSQTTEKFTDKALCVNFFGQNPRSAATAATLYGDHPVPPPLPPSRCGDADRCGWVERIVTDTASSRKFPARFSVLSKRVGRTVRGAGPSLRDFRSMASMSSGAETINIGFDTEFVDVEGVDPDRAWIGEDVEGGRRIVSYQFACVDVEDPEFIRLCVIIPQPYKGPRGPRIARLSQEQALNVLYEEFELWKHPLANGWKVQGVRVADAIEVGKDGKKVTRWGKWFSCKNGLPNALPITLVAHFQQADLTSFFDRRKALNTWAEHGYDVRLPGTRAGSESPVSRWLDYSVPDILRGVISASAGMVSPRDMNLVLDGPNRYWARPMKLTIADTMAHSGAASLRELGKSVNVPKLDVGDWITRMDELLEHDRERFLDYASNDAVIALEYVNRVYGDGRSFPISLPTGAARSARVAITEQIIAESEIGDFNGVFGGLEKVTQNTDPLEGLEGNELSFYKKRRLQPLDGAAATFIHAGAMSFRGGYNMCSEVGIFDELTYDFDLISCYPSAASCVLDVDYTHPDGVIEKSINNTRLTGDHFPSPLTPFFGFVTFDFPDTVAYPSLPVACEGSMVYPLSSGSSRGVWACGPEVYVALKLGAKVRCQIGHFARVRTVDGEPSRLLRHAYQQVINDRDEAKRVFGKKSFEQTILKLSANALYGKLAQGVKGQTGWDAWAQERDAVGGSAITSPYHASYTTGLVRAVLLATLNQLSELGYSTPSCTTDGFITNAPERVVEGLDLFGLADVWKDAREALTGSRRMWEEKHRQELLYNITTRGNVGREIGGVLAHAGLKLPDGIVSDSPEDRTYFWNTMVAREGAIPSTIRRFPSVQELTRIEDRLDFTPREMKKLQVIEFDRKRRPIPEGMSSHTIVVDGVEHEIAHVHSRPWNTPEEAILGRSVDKSIRHLNEETGEFDWDHSPVRKSVEQWHDYLNRLDQLLNNPGGKSDEELLKDIAHGVVIAVRQEVVSIPWLSCSTHTVSERLDMFPAFGLPRPKERFWHHARSKVERQIEIDLELIAPFVERMKNENPFE